jgi:hypothetical protein
MVEPRSRRSRSAIPQGICACGIFWAQTPFLQTIVCGHISVIQSAGTCSDRKIWPTFSELALVGVVDWCSVATDLLSRRTMAPAPPAPDPHAACCLHDQAVGGGNFRGALRSVQRGSLHVHAENYRESRSEAHAGQPMNDSFHGTSPLFKSLLVVFISGQIPQLIGDGCPQWLNLAHLAMSNASCHADGPLCLTACERVIEIQLPDPADVRRIPSRNPLGMYMQMSDRVTRTKPFKSQVQPVSKKKESEFRSALTR